MSKAGLRPRMLEKWDPGDELTQCMRSLRELLDQWPQEEDNMELDHMEEDENNEAQNLVWQMGWCPMKIERLTRWTGREGLKGGWITPWQGNTLRIGAKSHDPLGA